jgi:hypothetical protein
MRKPWTTLRRTTARRCDPLPAAPSSRLGVSHHQGGGVRAVVKTTIGTLTVLVGILAGCQAAESEQPQPPPPPPTIATEPAGDETPTYVEGGSAEDNLPYITWILGEAGAGVGLFGSLDAVAALEEAGFERSALEVTSDRTALELAAESITVSVLIQGDCAVAQWSSDWLVSSVQPLLGSGTCLLGDTLSLD